MKSVVASFLLLALLGAEPPQAAGADAQRDTALVEGRRIARMLLGQRPTADASVSGSIHIRPRGGKAREIPFRSSVTVGGNDWKTVYETEAIEGTPAVRLTIRHTSNVVAEFFVQDLEADGTFGEAVRLTWAEAFRPFVGSDFRIIDLAYPHSDHLTWPTQRLLSRDIRRGQSCHQLESVNPTPAKGGFAKVISWIDIDTGGPLEITGYDLSGDKLLQFSPKRFRKVNGEFKVTELHISNRQTRSRTVLRLVYGKPESEKEAAKAVESRRSALNARADALLNPKD